MPVRVVLRALLSALAVGVLVAPAASVAAPTPSPSGAPEAGQQLCGITDERLAEVSGLVATKDGFVAIGDGSADSGSILQLFELDSKCQVVERHYFEQDPYDPEDLAISSDGTLWVADIGDNDRERETVAVWKVAPDFSSATIHRMTYPDGAHDAEAMIMPPNGLPVIITKYDEKTGKSGVYVATEALKPNETVPMKKVGDVGFTNTGTPGGPLGAVSQRLVTGATLSSDGKRAVVRTYTDAYEYQVSDGDVAASIVKGSPIRTPLPNEPQGEAITFSTDGKRFITASESIDGEPAQVFSYVPKQPPPPSPAPKESSEGSLLDSLDLQDIKLLIAAVGVLGLVLVVLGVWGMRRARKGDDGDDERDSTPPPTPKGPPRGRAKVPGSGRPSGRVRAPSRGRGGDEFGDMWPDEPSPSRRSRAGRAVVEQRRGDEPTLSRRAAGRAAPPSSSRGSAWQSPPSSASGRAVVPPPGIPTQGRSTRATPPAPPSLPSSPHSAPSRHTGPWHDEPGYRRPDPDDSGYW